MSGLLPGWDAVPDPDGGSDVYYWNKVIPLQNLFGTLIQPRNCGTGLLSRWASQRIFVMGQYRILTRALLSDPTGDERDYMGKACGENRAAPAKVG